MYVSIGYKSEIIYNAFSIKYSLDRKLLLKNLQLVIKFGFQILKEDMQKVVLKKKKKNNNMRSAALLSINFS